MTQFQIGTLKMEIVVTNLFRNETKKGVFRMRKNKCNDFTVLADENRHCSTGSYYTNNSTNTIVHNHDKTRWMSLFTEITNNTMSYRRYSVIRTIQCQLGVIISPIITNINFRSIYSVNQVILNHIEQSCRQVLSITYVLFPYKSYKVPFS